MWCKIFYLSSKTFSKIDSTFRNCGILLLCFLLVLLVFFPFRFLLLKCAPAAQTCFLFPLTLLLSLEVSLEISQECVREIPYKGLRYHRTWPECRDRRFCHLNEIGSRDSTSPHPYTLFSEQQNSTHTETNASLLLHSCGTFVPLTLLSFFQLIFLFSHIRSSLFARFHVLLCIIQFSILVESTRKTQPL